MPFDVAALLQRSQLEKFPALGYSYWMSTHFQQRPITASLSPVGSLRSPGLLLTLAQDRAAALLLRPQRK